MGRAITPLFAAMLIALFVVPAPASPTLRTLWSIDTASSVQFIWFSQELVLQSAQTAENGGYLNVVQAMNSSETLWTYSSFGPVMTFTTAVTFENVHKLAFLLENNLQPPNVTAIVPSTGEVVWSSASAFPTATVPLLQTSFDGRSLYLFTVSSDGVTQLTAFDAATGETLFTRGEGNVAVNVTQCGPSRVPCVVEFLSNGSVVFWDGRTGATLTNSTLAFPSAANSVFAWLIPLSTDMMLFGLPGAVFGINTSNYTLAWSAEPQGSTFLAFAQPYRVGDAERIAAVVMGRTIIAGFDAATGSTLWSASVTSICPFSAPAPGRAHRFDQFSLGPFPSDLYGGGLFSFTAACSYTTSNDLLIVGAMSAVNGALKWWRYLSQAPSAYPLLPLGRKTFMVYSSLNSQEEFYAGDSANSFAAYPSSGPVSFLVAAAANGTAFLQYYSIQPSFAVVEVAGL